MGTNCEQPPQAQSKGGQACRQPFPARDHLSVHDSAPGAHEMRTRVQSRLGVCDTEGQHNIAKEAQPIGILQNVISGSGTNPPRPPQSGFPRRGGVGKKGRDRGLMSVTTKSNARAACKLKVRSLVSKKSSVDKISDPPPTVQQVARLDSVDKSPHEKYSTVS